MQEIPWTNAVPLLIVMVTKVNMDVFVLPRALYLIPGLHGRKILGIQSWQIYSLDQPSLQIGKLRLKR